MDTCHYCEDIVEKLNREYSELYAENEGHKQAIEFIRREMELRRMITEQLCKIKSFREKKEDMSVEVGIKTLVRNFISQSDEIKDLFREIEQLEEENSSMEAEHEQTCQELRDQVDLQFALERQNDKLKQTVAGLRWRQLTLTITSSS